MGISLSSLAAAVANEGGVGVIATVGIGQQEPDGRSNFVEANKRALAREIRKARNITSGIIGANVMMALSDHAEHIETCIREEVDIVFLGAGLPIRLSPRIPLNDLNHIHTKVVPIVSSARAVDTIFKFWWKHYSYVPPAVVIEGPLAGGHLGFSREQISTSGYELERLVPDVLTAIAPWEERSGHHVAVVAGGGVYDGVDIDRLFRIGAEGVQMGTRFVTTFECDASEDFKRAYVECSRDDLVIIDSPVGLPGRAIRNAFVNAVSRSQRRPFHCPYKCLKPCDNKTAPYCIADALVNARDGDVANGIVFAGANAYRSNAITSVAEVCGQLRRDYAEAAGRGTLPRSRS
ncbi:MAG: nitronate monooxygenase [Pirellulales bacterium]|nr:nitronate monooxygenase [Pirellulales bacterium]